MALWLWGAALRCSLIGSVCRYAMEDLQQLGPSLCWSCFCADTDNDRHRAQNPSVALS